MYEYQRKDKYSLIYIITLLIGIYGVLFYNEGYSIHYLFAFIVFISITIFMFHHCIKSCDKILYILSFMQFILLCITIWYIDSDILLSETLFIINFAVYYIYLHLSVNPHYNIH